MAAATGSALATGSPGRPDHRKPAEPPAGQIHAQVFTNLIEARGNLANNSMNLALRNLTLINVVFLPLNLIASIGGMSEFSMMTAGMPWWLAFPALMAAMAVLGGGMAIALRRMA
jgi:magnesium transporter